MKIDNIIHKGVGIVAFSALFLLGGCSDDFLKDKKDYNGFNDEIYRISVWRRQVWITFTDRLNPR